MFHMECIWTEITLIIAAAGRCQPPLSILFLQKKSFFFFPTKVPRYRQKFCINRGDFFFSLLKEVIRAPYAHRTRCLSLLQDAHFLGKRNFVVKYTTIFFSSLLYHSSIWQTLKKQTFFSFSCRVCQCHPKKLSGKGTLDSR